MFFAYFFFTFKCNVCLKHKIYNGNNSNDYYTHDIAAETFLVYLCVTLTFIVDVALKHYFSIG